MMNEDQTPLIDAITDSDVLSTITDSSRAVNETTLTWSHIHVECRQKPPYRYPFGQTERKAPRILLDDLSGIARPGQVLAIMGTSGVGKTTLLKVLSGQDDPRTTVTNGDVLIDGHMTTRPQRLSGSIIGLVEQNELFVETMSLEEHLIFQAMLRMPRSMIDNERRARVETIVTLLSLDECVKTAIRQLSGGERKRLAFATVLLTDPRVILIDEPTSGLDSYLARALMHMIRKMAVELRRTIIVVLHQPTGDMFTLLDSLCLLVHGGRQAFFGAVDEAATFFSSECGLSAASLDNYMEQLAAPPRSVDRTLHQGTMVADRFAQSIYGGELIDNISRVARQQSLNEFNSEATHCEGEVRYQSSFVRQVKWLLWRTYIADRCDPTRKINFLVQTLFMSLTIGVIFFRLQPTDNQYEQNINALSLVMFFAILESNMGLLMIGIPAERPRITRDWKRRIYSFHAYYLARWITDTCFTVFSSILYLSIVVFLVDMRRWLLVISIGTLEVLTACGLASFVASLASSPQAALLVLQPLQMSLGQFSGFYMNSHSIPGYISWIHYFSYIHYGYKLMLITQWHNVSMPCDSLSVLVASASPTRGGQLVCTRTGDDILIFYGADPNSFSVNIILLTILGIIFHLAAYTINLIRLRRVV